MTTDVIVRKPISEAIKLKRLEIKASKEESRTELISGLLLHPAVIYTVLVLLLEYLSTHPENAFEWFGGSGQAFISKDTAKVITAGLTAGLAANALGGASGIASIIKALK